MRYTLVDFFGDITNIIFSWVGIPSIWCDFCVVYFTIKRWEWEGATTIHITCNYYMQNAMILLFDTSFFFFLNYRKLCDLGGRRRKVQTFGGGYMFFPSFFIPEYDTPAHFIQILVSLLNEIYIVLSEYTGKIFVALLFFIICVIAFEFYFQNSIRNY